MLARPAINQDSVSLYEYLVDVDHQTATVAQSVRAFYPLYHCVAVGLIFRGRTKVSRTESVSFFDYSQIVMRDDPTIIDSCHLLHFVFFAIVVDGSGARAKNAQNCINLLSQLSSNQIVGVGFPDGEDAANCKIIVDDGAAI